MTGDEPENKLGDVTNGAPGAATETDVVEADDLMSGRQELADSVKTDTEQRKRDYREGKTRNTSSKEYLVGLAMSIYDGTRKLVGRLTGETVPGKSASDTAME